VLEGLDAVRARICEIDQAVGLVPTPVPDAPDGASFASALDRASSTTSRALPTLRGAVSGRARLFIDAALRQRGDRYVYGAQTQASHPNPQAFDCSELVKWSAAQAGVAVPDGAWWQYRALADSGHAISVQDAMHTPGALLFRFAGDPRSPGGPAEAHVAISLGDGRTIEARSRRDGVGVFDAAGRGWTAAAVVPGL
jgi:cell wall-associated NlpC family hydrolase